MIGRHEELKDKEMNLHNHPLNNDYAKKKANAAADSIFILADGGNNSIGQTASNLSPATTNPPSRMGKLPPLKRMNNGI